MSKIQQVQQNYSSSANGSSYKVKPQTSFCGLSASDKLVIKAATKEIDSQLDFRNKEGFNKVKYFFLWTGKKVHNFLSENAGEKETQLLNSLFTATLAPLMIWKNPFLKKDEDQKKYAALRQPLSAIIAITGGLAMTIGINNFVEKITDEGYIKTLDGRISPSKNHMNKMFMTQLGTDFKNVDLNDQKAVSEFLSKHNIENVDSDLFEKKPGNFITRAYQRSKVKKAILENYQEKIKEERKVLTSHLIGTEPDMLSLEKVGNDKVIYSTIDGKKVEIGRNIPNLETELQLQGYLDDHNVYRLKFIDVIEKHSGIEIYKDGPLKGQTKPSSKQIIDETKALDFANGFGLTGDATTYIKKTDDNKIIPTKITEEVLGEILLKKNDKKRSKGAHLADDVSTELGKSESRTTKIINGVSNEPKIRLTDLFDEVREKKTETVTKKLESLFGADITKITVADAAKQFITELDLFNKAGTHNATVFDIAQNLTDNKIKNLGKFKAYKGYVGILFNLVSTAITCSVLNWVYPRFIEKYFPELVSKDKSAKGGNK